jgi:signal transduction histidine kinase
MSQREGAVLYVDDEVANLTAFSYCFDDQFVVHTANSAGDALAILQREPVALLLADQRMPGMSGAQLCALVRERHPDVVRMIVTAYADIADAVAAINTGQVARYILKPWREEAMLEILRSGVEAFQLGSMVRELQVRILKNDQQSTTTFLVGRVLHELSNPATSVATNVQWAHDCMHRVRDMAPRNPELQELLKDLSAALADAVEGCQELGRRLQRFREGQPVPQRTVGVELARIVDAAAAIVRGMVRERAHLLVEHGAVPRVAIDGTHLSQVLVNLLMNAAEAIPGGKPDDNRVVVRTFAHGAVGVIEVQDSGVGIALDRLGEVFEPHYTSKPGPGHGLGLSIARELVEAAKGNITVRSDEKGTTFRVEIPILR